MNNRRDREFRDTEAYLALQHELIMPEGVVLSIKNLDAILRSELGLNHVSFIDRHNKYDEKIGVTSYVNMIDYVGIDEDEGYPAYTDKLYIKSLGYENSGVDGYDFILKDYCKECRILYGVVYVDIYNHVWMRMAPIGPMTDKNDVLAICEMYAGIPYPWHGKSQFGLDWKPCHPDKWIWHPNERNELEMVDFYSKVCDFYQKLNENQ